MAIIPSQKAVRRAKARLARRVYAVIAVVTLAFIAIKAVHYLLGWW